MSYGRLGVALGCIEKLDDTKTAYVRRVPRAVISEATMPAAPARLSTTNCWPQASVSFFTDDARHHVAGAAVGEADQHAHWAGGVIHLGSDRDRKRCAGECHASHQAAPE